jgi:hypothetical protein
LVVYANGTAYSNSPYNVWVQDPAGNQVGFPDGTAINSIPQSNATIDPLGPSDPASSPADISAVTQPETATIDSPSTPLTLYVSSVSATSYSVDVQHYLGDGSLVDSPIQGSITPGQTLSFDVSTIPQVPTVSISSITQPILDDSTGTKATFDVSLSQAASQTVQVSYYTQLGTANVSDLTPQAGNITFAPGQTSAQVSVPIADGRIYSAPQTFSVGLDHAVDADLGTSQGQATIVSLPGQPVVTATAENGGVRLNWTPPDNGGSPITAYTIYRSTSPGNESKLAKIGAHTSYTDSNVSNGTTYYYKVSATTALGQGARSAEVSATPGPPPICQGATITWTGDAGDSKWSTPANWNPARVPVASDNVCINTGSGVTVDQAATVASLEADVPLTIDARLQLTSTTQGSTFADGGSLSGPDSAELDVAGTLDLTAGTFTWGQIFTGGQSADVTWASTFGGTGTVIVHSGAILDIGGSQCTQKTHPGLDYSGGCLSFTPALRNDGTVDLVNGTLFRDSAQPWINTGTLTLGDYPADPHAGTAIWGGCPTPSGLTCDPFPLTSTGTISRITGPDPTSMQNVQLATSGNVQLSGSLIIVNQNWTASLGGAWTVNAGATLQLGGTNMAVTLAAGATMSGAGTLQLGYNGAAASLDLAGTFILPAVTVSAGSAHGRRCLDPD